MAETIGDLSDRVPQAWTSQSYAEAFHNNQQIEIPPDCTLRGRILRGRSDKEFETLGTPDRGIVFIIGSDGLSAMPGLEPLTALDQIGLTPQYVQGRIAQGYHFKFLVFEGGHIAPLATWDNALDMVTARHPELAGDIEQHRTILKVTPFADWQAKVNESLDDIELAGVSHPEYMSLERYQTLSVEQRADPLMLRRLLFHLEHLGTLFYGDGYTRTPDGEVGIAEYLVPNGRVDKLPEAIVIDLF